MLSREERTRIYRQAYIPEHLPEYVASVSGSEPHLIDSYLCFSRRRHMIFIGFPLGDSGGEVSRAYRNACERCKPATVSVIASKIWLGEEECEKQPPDTYYRLKLPLEAIPSEVSYMVRRAQKDIIVATGRFGREHKRIVQTFIKNRRFSPEQIHLFKHIQDYLKRSPSAVLLDARKGGRLAAFTILDLGSCDHAFYLFNFRSVEANIPGSSDLLFREMVNIAQSNGKIAINLGLAINPGIRRFKEKWGGVPFMPYEGAFVFRAEQDLDVLARKL